MGGEGGGDLRTAIASGISIKDSWVSWQPKTDTRVSLARLLLGIPLLGRLQVLDPMDIIMDWTGKCILWTRWTGLENAVFENAFFENAFFENFADFWRARSRLYQNEILQENMRLTAFFKLYKICILFAPL